MDIIKIIKVYQEVEQFTHSSGRKSDTHGELPGINGRLHSVFKISNVYFYRR